MARGLFGTKSGLACQKTRNPIITSRTRKQNKEFAFPLSGF